MSRGSGPTGAGGIPAPYALTSGVLSEWITPDELLIVQVRNALAGLTLSVGARLWNPDTGVVEFNQDIVPTSDRSQNTFSVQLYYGWLVSAAIRATVGSPRRGQTLATLSLARPPAAAFRPKMILAQDYVTSQYGPLWPGGRQGLGVEGPGMLYSFAVAAPAAGADWTQTVPTGARWLLHGIEAVLTTGAAVAARQPVLQFTDGTNILFSEASSVTQAASLLNVWDWIPNYPSTGILAIRNQIALPFPVPLFAGWVVRTVTANLQALDTWTGIRLLVEEWLED